tara:strand:+ start:7992 stop:9641 length:1650 start_codon:yes stop_codon:yes gene_type:complete
MGIPYYFTYLIKNHTQIIDNLKNKTTINNLFLDSNSLVYDSIDYTKFENKSQFENYIIKSVVEKLELIIKTINPTNRVFIAFDGVPPIAKLNQQKNRRYKTWYQNSILNKDSVWDTCAITPGTIFMDKLKCVITQHFTSTNINKPKIILSLSDVPGEGEHKIYEYIRNNNLIHENALIYGMDADLIMLSLNHLKYCSAIYLYRETPHFISNIDINLNSDEKYLININLLGNQIYKELTDDITRQTDTPQWLVDASNNMDYIFTETQNRDDKFYAKIDDYIFICFLLGNDFLPHFAAINIRINGFTVLIELYKSLFGVKKYLIKNGTIVLANFKLFIGKLAENEENYLKELYNIRNKQSKKRYSENTEEERLNKFVAIPMQDRNIELFINPYEAHWEYRYYYSLFDVDVDCDSSVISNICKNYLETLLWTYYYYSKECVNWNHYYKYHYPPLLIDLYKHIPYFDSELVLPKNNNVIHPYLLLAYVLPKKSLDLLPDKIHNYLLKNYENHYGEDYEFVYAFCKYFWEGHVKFLDLDFDKFAVDINKLILLT